jgi:RNA polymerase sigma-70 factor, ECF subfamily
MNILDTTLLEEIRQGNLKSFELVFKGYYSRLCKYAYSILKNEEAASDQVKDIFIHWWEDRSRVMVTESLSGYLYKSVHNKCINYLSRTLAKQRDICESDLAMPIAELTGPLSVDYPMANLLAMELEDALDKAIQKLPDQCREIFILSRIEQLSHEEIAQKLNISPNTVKVHIYRALIKLKEELKEYLPLFFLFFTAN